MIYKEIDKRKEARILAEQAITEGNPLDWFEILYSKSENTRAIIPWADMAPNPNVVEFFERNGLSGNGNLALKVGCGLGDDAEYLSDLGFNVFAFDISPTAIRKAKGRFPNSKVLYLIEDLFTAPVEWNGLFDFVLESYTLQVLPSNLRKKAIKAISSFVSPGGNLLVVTRARNDHENKGAMPWPLTESEVRNFEKYSMNCNSFEDYTDNENPPIRRFRAHFIKLVNGQ
ncbi:class I SAM-dependent methyltransferase [candidate division KSB1 bacterium]|nr:class I SAM-dependent methyltransferase [candidate division KSB1 bacterium]